MFGNSNYYPKNWGAMGYGWHNFAALGYAKAPDTQSYQSNSSSGVSSLYPSTAPYPTSSFYPSTAPYPTSGLYPSMPALPDGGASLSYGFNTNVLPKPVSSLYPKLSLAEESDISTPTIEAPTSTYVQEIPCASITVPLEENTYWMEDIRRKVISWPDYKKRLEDRLRQEDSHSLGPKPITIEEIKLRKKQEEDKKQQTQKALIKKKKKRGGRHVQFSKEARDLHR